MPPEPLPPLAWTEEARERRDEIVRLYESSITRRAMELAIKDGDRVVRVKEVIAAFIHESAIRSSRMRELVEEFETVRAMENAVKAMEKAVEDPPECEEYYDEDDDSWLGDEDDEEEEDEGEEDCHQPRTFPPHQPR